MSIINDVLLQCQINSVILSSVFMMALKTIGYNIFI